MTEVPEVVIENAEMANDDEIVNPTKTKKEIDAMKNPVANAVKTKDKKKVIKGLHVDNVVVVYKDEIGRIDKLRFSFDCPLVDESWLPLAARKMLSLHLESENILPTQILSVSLPAQGGKEIEIEPTFLEKPIGKLNKKEIVWAAIYYKYRTVAPANEADEDRMQQSLWLHVHGVGGEINPTNDCPPFDATAMLKETK